MARNDVKHIHRVRKTLSGGRVVEYHYAWRGGPRFWSSTEKAKKHGADYWSAYNNAVAERRPSHGKFRDLLTKYLDSPDFAKLKPRTQADIRRSIFCPGGIDAKFGDGPTGIFDRPEIRGIAYDWRDGFGAARTADMRLSHLARIVNWLVDRGNLKAHHLRGMTQLYEVDRSDIVWLDDEIAAFEAGAPEWVARILIAATETGLRPGDLARLNRTHIRQASEGRRIMIRTGKRNRLVSIPVTPRMGRLIDATPAIYSGASRLHILSMARGGPVTVPDKMGREVSKWRDKLGLRPEIRLYDARGTAATRLYNADATLREIALCMGWSVAHTAKMIEIYVAMHPASSDAVQRKLANIAEPQTRN